MYKNICIPEKYRETIDLACALHQDNLDKLSKQNMVSDPTELRVYNEILQIVDLESELKLSEYQLAYILVLIDYTNQLILQKNPPYSSIENRYFTQSQGFMKRFNKSTDSIIEHWDKFRIKLNKKVV